MDFFFFLNKYWSHDYIVFFDWLSFMEHLANKKVF